MEDNIFDFDLDIDNFLDVFTEEQDTTDTVHLPSQNNSVPTKQNEKHKQGVVAKRNAIQMTPKVMKNDIRRYYSRMLVNTINSGDFSHLQSFFSTFMTGSTKFFVNYDNFDPTYRIPARIMTDGPKMMSHYFLGIFVMYPDVVMSMDNAVITTSNTWSGTKIQMNVGFSATKTYDLTNEEWVPPLHILEEKCQKVVEDMRNKASPEKNRNVLQERHRSVAATSSSSSFNVGSKAVVGAANSSSSSSSSSGGVRSAGPSDNFFPSNFNDVNNYGHNSSRSQGQGGVHIHTPDSSRTSTSTDADSAARKRQRLLSAFEDTSPSVSSTHTGAATLPYVSHFNENNISDEYVHALCARAKIVPRPMEVRMKGTITMFLDTNNHIQHMTMTLNQI